MCSEWRTVARRWVIVKHVRPCRALLRLSWTIFSPGTSDPDVASPSKSSFGGRREDSIDHRQRPIAQCVLLWLSFEWQCAVLASFLKNVAARLIKVKNQVLVLEFDDVLMIFARRLSDEASDHFYLKERVWHDQSRKKSLFNLLFDDRCNDFSSTDIKGAFHRGWSWCWAYGSFGRRYRLGCQNDLGLDLMVPRWIRRSFVLPPAKQRESHSRENRTRRIRYRIRMHVAHSDDVKQTDGIIECDHISRWYFQKLSTEVDRGSDGLVVLPWYLKSDTIWYTCAMEIDDYVRARKR